MPAPRTCRSCGVDLAPDVRWCTSCFAPITDFTSRERLHQEVVGTPQPDVRSSRWKKAVPLSFGPVGRLLITAFVLLMGPWTNSFFSLLYAPIWLGLSVVVLRQVWRRETLDADAPPTAAERFRERHPLLGHRFDGSSVVIALTVLLLVTVVVLMIKGDTARFYALAALCSMLGLAAFIAWVVAL